MGKNGDHNVIVMYYDSEIQHLEALVRSKIVSLDTQSNVLIARLQDQLW